MLRKAFVLLLILILAKPVLSAVHRRGVLAAFAAAGARVVAPRESLPATAVPVIPPVARAAESIVAPELRIARAAAFKARLDRVFTILNNYGGRDRSPFGCIDALLYLHDKYPGEMTGFAAEINTLTEQIANEILAGQWDRWSYSGGNRVPYEAAEANIGKDILDRALAAIGRIGLTSRDWDQIREFEIRAGAELDSVIAKDLNVSIHKVSQAIHLILTPESIFDEIQRDDLAQAAPQLFDEHFYQTYLRAFARVSPTKALFVRRYFQDFTQASLQHRFVDKMGFQSVFKKLDANNVYQGVFLSEELIPSFYFSDNQKFSYRALDPQVHAEYIVRAIADMQQMRDNLNHIPFVSIRARLDVHLVELQTLFAEQLKTLPQDLRSFWGGMKDLENKIVYPSTGLPNAALSTRPLEMLPSSSVPSFEGLTAVSAQQWNQAVMQLIRRSGLPQNLSEQIVLQFADTTESAQAAELHFIGSEQAQTECSSLFAS